MEEVEILQGRAKTFLKYAKEALKRGDFDFACFSSEQAAQLFVKSVILELIGEVPRLHRVRELLYLLSKSVPEMEKPITKFIEENREVLRTLDDAYITSRYMPSTYTCEDAEMLVKLAEDLIEFLSRVLRECKH
ncbi:MAG: HEPN domain-containing protein [Candidatus Methanomethylicaceae archaeon]